MKKILSLLTAILSLTTLLGCNESKKQSKEHAFSVSDTKQVYFAKSNLQYNQNSKSWFFAEHCYDYIGLGNESLSSEVIDLFGWGSVANPTNISTDNNDYGDGPKDIEGTNLDFGIGLSKQIGEGYRMFSHTEIHYLLMFRDNASNLFGHGTINGNKGLIILPDDFSLPSGISFTSSPNNGFTNQYNWYWTNFDKDAYIKNNYSLEEWSLLEKEGAIFLPGNSGMRCGEETSHVGISGHYWTSSHYGDEFANCLCIFPHDLFLEGNFDKCYGLSVRLVKDA